MRKKVRSRLHLPTNLASNPAVQPRSGDTSLALGECGESREPSVTQGIGSEVLGGEGLCNHFKGLNSNRNIPGAMHYSFLGCRTRIDWKMLDCYALSGRTGSIVSLSQGGAALCPGLWCWGLSGQ